MFQCVLYLRPDAHHILFGVAVAENRLPMDPVDRLFSFPQAIKIANAGKLSVRAPVGIDLPKIAAGCGYKTVMSVATRSELDAILPTLTALPAPLLLEIKVKKGSRDDLGRPTTTPVENKEALMSFLEEE